MRIALLRPTLATYNPRRKAIAKVTDQGVLAKVAMVEEEKEIREQVLERISDPAILEESTDSYLQVRPEKDAQFFLGRVPPGQYALKVGFDDYKDFRSARDETVTGNLLAGHCYRIASGKTLTDVMGASKWSPKIVEERCPKTK